MARHKVLVVGAGIGGLSAAIGLHKAGHEVAVFDKATSWEKLHVGGGMQLGVNAMKGLREIGVVDDVVAAGTAVLHQEVRSPRGALLADWPVAQLAKEHGVNDVRIVRADFHKALAGRVSPDVMHFGRSVASFTQDASGVTLRFADGSEERGDLLVGADGLPSPIRAQLHGRSEPRYAGYAYWRGQTDAPHPAVAEGASQLFLGAGVRFAYYAVGDRHVSWWSVANAPRGKKPVVKADVLARHKGWASPIEEILAMTPDAKIDYVDIMDRDPIDSWGEGRVTLLGDAAHPMTIDIAQGACQAVEDAVVLMQSLDRHDDVVAALRAYEGRRVPRTSKVVLQARGMGKMLASESAPKTFMRNRFMQFGGSKVLWNRQKSVLAYDFINEPEASPS